MLLLDLGKKKKQKAISSSKHHSVSLRRYVCLFPAVKGERAHANVKQRVPQNFPQLSASVNIKQAFAAGVLECVGRIKYASTSCLFAESKLSRQEKKKKCKKKKRAHISFLFFSPSVSPPLRRFTTKVCLRDERVGVFTFDWVKAQQWSKNMPDPKPEMKPESSPRKQRRGEERRMLVKLCTDQVILWLPN